MARNESSTESEDPDDQEREDRDHLRKKALAYLGGIEGENDERAVVAVMGAEKEYKSGIGSADGTSMVERVRYGAEEDMAERKEMR